MATVTIPLTKDKVALIDEADLPLVSQHSWHATRGRSTWYAATKALGADGREHGLSLHQLIMAAPADREIDHISRDGLDCRRENLRIATRTQNAGNATKRTHNTSGWKGVLRDHKRGAWIARISHEHRTYHLGRFVDPIDAARAYDAKARELFGEFACVNFPGESLPPSAEPNTQPRNPRANRTGYRGVCLVRAMRNPWRATIKDGEKIRVLGYFTTPEEAARVYDVAARAAFGTRACLNFPMNEP